MKITTISFLFPNNLLYCLPEDNIEKLFELIETYRLPIRITIQLSDSKEEFEIELNFNPTVN